MYCKLNGIKIAAIRSVVPDQEIRLEDETAYYGGSQKKIARMRATLGMDRRRVCAPFVTSSDLCAHAAEKIFEAHPETRPGIDVLIFVSQSPDWIQPATACELQDRLHLPKTCAAFDVNQGCAGYIYGLWLAASLVAAGSAANALLLVGDVNPIGRDPRNRVTTPVFGDGGSATLITRGSDAISFEIGTDGSQFEAIITPGGQARIPWTRQHERNEALAADNPDQAGNPWQLLDVYMDGGAVFNFTMEIVPGHIMEFIGRNDLVPENIAALILHQANGQIVGEIARRAGFRPEQAPAASFSLYGNLASASIPAAICEAWSKTAMPGQPVVLCGYGIGFSWGSCLCNLKDCDCQPVLDFHADPNRPTRDQRIARWQKIFKGEISRNDPV